LHVYKIYKIIEVDDLMAQAATAESMKRERGERE